VRERERERERERLGFELDFMLAKQVLYCLSHISRSSLPHLKKLLLLICIKELILF
jgi:hypothetical protein